MFLINLVKRLNVSLTEDDMFDGQSEFLARGFSSLLSREELDVLAARCTDFVKKFNINPDLYGLLKETDNPILELFVRNLGFVTPDEMLESFHERVMKGAKLSDLYYDEFLKISPGNGAEVLMFSCVLEDRYEKKFKEVDEMMYRMQLIGVTTLNYDLAHLMKASTIL